MQHQEDVLHFIGFVLRLVYMPISSALIRMFIGAATSSSSRSRPASARRLPARNARAHSRLPLQAT
jgi:hypothetical protein